MALSSGSLSLLILGLVLLGISSCQQLYMADLCRERDIQNEIIGDTGIIGTKNSTVPVLNPCVMRIQTCANCYISVEPMGRDFYLKRCQAIDLTAKTCSKNCEYLFLFDGYYMNETIRFISDSGSSSWKKPFITESSILYIGFCHSASIPNIQLNYTIKRKNWLYEGSSIDYMDRGAILSPFFPNTYIMNAEWYIYEIRSHQNTDYIYLIFTDWHLSYTSEVVIDQGVSKSTYRGTDSRPVLFSKYPRMRIIFETGMEYQNLVLKSNIGFKANYRFYRTERTDIPYTNCGSYEIDKEGGMLQLTTTNMRNYQLYDCVWVVRTQPGYVKTTLNLLKFNIMTEYKDNYLEIYGGLSSQGKLIKRYVGEYRVDEWQHSHTEGFYIHLYGKFGSLDSIKFSYASVDIGPACKQGLFRCSNGYCIATKYKCDRVNNCGDNSDEQYGCSGSSWQSSNQQTIAVSVIIPVVISIFLIIILFVLFLLVRRYRKANMSSHLNSDVPSISGQVSRRNRRRHRRRGPLSFDRDLPPSYEVAIQSPPLYPNMDMEAPHPDSWMLPKPPPYSESISTQPAYTSSADPSQPVGQLYNTSSDSTHSDPWRQINSDLPLGNSAFSYADQHVRPTIHSHSTSYSSESSFDNSDSPRPARFSGINSDDLLENNREVGHLDNEESDQLHYQQGDELPVRNIILPPASLAVHDDGRERQVQEASDGTPHIRKNHNNRAHKKITHQGRDRNNSGNLENHMKNGKEEHTVSSQERSPASLYASVASTSTQTKHRHAGKDRGNHRQGNPHIKQNLHNRSRQHASTPALSSQTGSASRRLNNVGNFRSVDNIPKTGSNASCNSPERIERECMNRKMNKKHKRHSKSAENIACAGLSLRPDSTLDTAMHPGNGGYLGHGDIGTAPQSRQSWSPRDGVATLSPSKSSTEGSRETLFKQKHFDHRSLGCVNDAFSDDHSSAERINGEKRNSCVSSPDISPGHSATERSTEQRDSSQRNKDTKQELRLRTQEEQQYLQLSPEIEDNDDVFV